MSCLPPFLNELGYSQEISENEISIDKGKKAAKKEGSVTTQRKAGQPSNERVKVVSKEMLEMLQKKHGHFIDALRTFAHEDYRTILLAWFILRSTHPQDIMRDEVGRYFVKT